MNCRKAGKDDLPAIMEIITQAQEFMAGMNLDQWNDGYPQRESFEDDIARNECYVLEDEAVRAVFTLTLIPEFSYRDIHDGRWLTEGENYAVIHRSAVGASCRGKGVGRELMSHAFRLASEQGAASVRIDTHRDNAPMRGLLEKCGFTYCGVIFLFGPDKPRHARVAYEKILKEQCENGSV